MDEREELRIEAPVRAQLRRELDSIEIGPLSRYSASAQHPRRSGAGLIARPIVNASVVAVVIVTAVVVGSVLGERRGVPASPSVSPLPFGPSSDHGLIVSTRDGFVIRSESDPAVIRRIEPTRPLSEHAVAVSRDGRLVAYWRPQSGQYGDALMLYDAATDADPRVLLQLSTAQLGGALVWADDGSGLAFMSQLSRGPAPGPVARLQTIELKGGLASGQPREIATASDARTVLRPLAWIRETRTVSAVEGSVDGFASNYVMASEDGAVSRVALRSGDQVVMSDSVVADPQSRFLAYVVTFTCQDGTRGCTLVRFWALEDPKIAIGWQAPPGSTYVRAVWRPFSREVALLVRRGGESHVEFWSSAKFGSARSIGPVPGDLWLLMQPDGRSFLLSRPVTGGLVGALYEVVTGSGVPIDLTRSGADAGLPTLSATIGPNEAERIARLTTASPLLTDAEAIELVRATLGPDRVDRISAALERGTYPRGGVAPSWKVRAEGEFQQRFRSGQVSPPIARCGVWTFNARSGQLTGVRMGANPGDCAAF
jgi:hypothetical protein